MISHLRSILIFVQLILHKECAGDVFGQRLRTRNPVTEFEFQSNSLHSLSRKCPWERDESILSSLQPWLATSLREGQLLIQNQFRMELLTPSRKNLLATETTSVLVHVAFHANTHARTHTHIHYIS